MEYYLIREKKTNTLYVYSKDITEDGSKVERARVIECNGNIIKSYPANKSKLKKIRKYIKKPPRGVKTTKIEDSIAFFSLGDGLERKIKEYKQIIKKA